MCLLYGTVIKTIADSMLIALEPAGTFSQSYGLGCGFLSMFGTGWTSVSLIVCVQMACADEDLGMATLILGSVRAIGGSAAVTIYSTLLSNTMSAEAGPAVAKAVLPMGFTMEGLPALVVDLINENVVEAAALPGMTTAMLDAARRGLENAWTLGFHKMYIAAASAAAVSVVAAAFSRDVTQRMVGAAGEQVAVQLENDMGAEKKNHVA